MDMKKTNENVEMTPIKQIADEFLKANTILIFPHVLVDGDALGSAVALCRALRQKDKHAYIVLEDKVPEYLEFLDDGLCTLDKDIIQNPDICVSVDCADPERFALRKEKFFSGKTTICIDHHKTAENFAMLNHIDGYAAATAEIVFKILCEMGISIDKLIGEAIYAAILTDTGSFQYSNTRIETHMIVIKLYEAGIDHTYVSRMLYQNNRIEKLYIMGKILNTLKSLADGKVAIVYVTNEMLKEAGALMEDTEGMSEILRNISGVEVGIFAKETVDNKTKFSMRSKEWADVSEIAMKHNGGGHTKAAGCTMNKPVFEAVKIIEADVLEYFAKSENGI